MGKRSKKISHVKDTNLFSAFVLPFQILVVIKRENLDVLVRLEAYRIMCENDSKRLDRYDNIATIYDSLKAAF